jgi:hypothetical protein
MQRGIHTHTHFPGQCSCHFLRMGSINIHQCLVNVNKKACYRIIGVSKISLVKDNRVLICSFRNGKLTISETKAAKTYINELRIA